MEDLDGVVAPKPSPLQLGVLDQLRVDPKLVELPQLAVEVARVLEEVNLVYGQLVLLLGVKQEEDGLDVVVTDFDPLVVEVEDLNDHLPEDHNGDGFFDLFEGGTFLECF